MSNTPYKTPTEIVREGIKALGIKANQATVRTGSNSVKLVARGATLTDAQVAALYKLVSSVEHIRYCQLSGDILGGGNTFTDLRIEGALKEAHRQRYVSEVRDALVLLVARYRAGETSAAESLPKNCWFSVQHGSSSGISVYLHTETGTVNGWFNVKEHETGGEEKFLSEIAEVSEELVWRSIKALAKSAECQ